MRRIWLWMAVGLGCVGVALAGCRKDQAGGSGGGPTGTGPASGAVGGAAGGAASGDIKVGVCLPFSGALASYGNSAMDGIKLRARQINDAGGIGGRKIALVAEDNRGDKTDTRNAFKKLATVDGVAAVIGPLTSTAAFGAKLDATQFRVPMITPAATNDKVTQGSGYVFRAIFNDSFQGRIAAGYAAKTGIRKAAVMTDKNSDYSKGLSASFTEAFEKAGGRIAASEGYQQKDTDFGGQLVKIKRSGAEIIFVPGYPPEVPLIVKHARVVGFEGRLFGADGWDSDDVIQKSGDNIVGCWLVGAFSPADQRPVVQDFVREMKAASGGRMPGGFEALAYDSVSLLAEAIRTHGPSREGVRAGLLAIRDFEAVTGRITMTPSGDAIKNAVILRIVKEGEAYAKQYVETVAP